MKLPKIASLLNPINLIQKVNDLIDVARSPLKRSTAYVVGDMVYPYAYPSFLYLECIQAGTTSFYNLSLSETVGAELTDGTVKWKVRNANEVFGVLDANKNKGNSTTPIYFDANGVAQTTKNFNDYELKSNVTSKGSTNQGVYFDASGVAQPMAYSVNKTVPADAKFTDTIVDISGKVNKSGDTMSGDLNFKDGASSIRFNNDSNSAYYVCGDDNVGLHIYRQGNQYAGLTELSASNGEKTTIFRFYANGKFNLPTPDKSENSNMCATTKFVKDNLVDYLPISQVYDYGNLDDLDKSGLYVVSGVTATGFESAKWGHVIQTARSNGNQLQIYHHDTNTDCLRIRRRYVGNWGEWKRYLPWIVGSIVAMAGSPKDGHFLLCDGSAVSRTTYAELFAVIGTTYGAGNGNTTFNLPNLIDKFIEGGSTFGTTKDAGLPNITGSAWFRHYADDRPTITNVSGAFTKDRGSKTEEGTGKATGYYPNVETLDFNASNSNAIYGASTTVQPPAIVMKFYIAY